MEDEGTWDRSLEDLRRRSLVEEDRSLGSELGKEDRTFEENGEGRGKGRGPVTDEYETRENKRRTIMYMECRH